MRRERATIAVEQGAPEPEGHVPIKCCVVEHKDDVPVKREGAEFKEDSTFERGTV